MGSTKKLLLIILYYTEHILYISDKYYVTYLQFLIKKKMMIIH